jgi:quercetin dioxygenase-like cupin family protein
MKLLSLLLPVFLFAQDHHNHGESKAALLLTKDLPGIAGKEVSMLTIELPPGHVSPPHRHNASVFVYVLEGSIIMGVKGGKEVTLKAGETFYENPTDIHTVGKNASATKPAKFLVMMVKDKGAPVAIPAP